ncbi:MAG: Asp-tRNA(Asn)/Glu-tRNA(Gln) amidotransferase subunit GatC [Christensenellales bacterium]|jgi:aspartyl-tRNA(Asn)/glutamyl-tRNA(Gln) amidotransferase subunit C
MKITREHVEHAAALAMISIGEDEMDALVEDMGNIIEIADKLSALDASGIIPTTHAMPVENVLREDKLVPYSDRAALLQNAPEKDECCFIVPKVVE